MSNRKMVNLAGNLRAMRFPRRWLTETIKLLCVIHAGSYSVVNRRKIANRRNQRREKRSQLNALCLPFRPTKKLAEHPPYSHARAWATRRALEIYYKAVESGVTRGQAEDITRAFLLLIFRKATCDNNLRKIIVRVEQRGGMARAPIEAYADGRSVPHGFKSASSERMSA